MRKKTLVGVLSIGICFLLSLTVIPSVSAKEKITLTFATYTSDATVHQHVYNWWVKELEKRTGGRVEVKQFKGGSLAKARDMINAGKTGLADIVQVVPLYDPTVLRLSAVPCRPFGTPQRADLYTLAFNKLAQSKYLVEEYKNLNLKYLFLNPSGNHNIMSKRPIKSIEDLKGLKIRASAGYAILLKHFGAVPVHLSAPDIYNAVERGVVDAALAPGNHFFYAFQIAEACKNGYYTDNLDMGFSQTIAAMNLKKYNSLPEDVKYIMEELAREIPRKAQEIEFPAWLDRKYYGLFKDLGIQTVKFSAGDRAKMKKVQEEKFSEQWIRGWEAKDVPAREVMSEWKAIQADAARRFPNGSLASDKGL